MTIEQRLQSVEAQQAALDNDLDHVKQTLIQVSDILYNTAERQRANTTAIAQASQRLNEVGQRMDGVAERLDEYAARAEERERQVWSVLNVLIEDNVEYRNEIRAIREENRKILEYLFGQHGQNNGNT